MATVHNIIMDKTARSPKRKGKKLSKRLSGRDRDSKSHGSKVNGSAAFSSPPKKQAKLSQDQQVTHEGGAPGAVLMSQDQGIPVVGSSTLSGLLGNGSLSDSHTLMSSLLAPSSGTLLSSLWLA